MSVEPFVHYIVDLSLKDIITAKGENVTLCMIESNAPLLDETQEGEFYHWGKAIEAGKPLTLDSGCFSFVLVKNCCGDLGVFVVAGDYVAEPTFQALIYEGDELIVARPSDASPDMKAGFDFAWLNAGQRLRIETIPDFETFDEVRAALWSKQEKREEEEGGE